MRVGERAPRRETTGALAGAGGTFLEQRLEEWPREHQLIAAAVREKFHAEFPSFPIWLQPGDARGDVREYHAWRACDSLGANIVWLSLRDRGQALALLSQVEKATPEALLRTIAVFMVLGEASDGMTRLKGGIATQLPWHGYMLHAKHLESALPARMLSTQDLDRVCRDVYLDNIDFGSDPEERIISANRYLHFLNERTETDRKQARNCGDCPGKGDGRPPPRKPWQDPKVLAALLAGILLAVGWVGHKLGLSRTIATPLYLVSIAIGGYAFMREAAEELWKEHEIGIELLMTVAAVAAGALGAWEEAAMLVFLYSISEASEGYAADRARAAVRALMDLTPKTALVRCGAEELRIPVEQLVIGDLFIVHPGESLPTDGEIVEGRSAVDQSTVTGESIPVEKAPRDGVFAGTVNGEGALVVRATKPFAENTVARIVAIIERAQASKGESQRFIERFGNRYSPAVLGVGVLVAVLPPLLGYGSWIGWVTRATVFIVAAAPCALVISIPITLVAAIGTAGRNGVLVKGGVHLERLAHVTVVALDKTGTLTEGRPRVHSMFTLGGVDEKRLLTLAAALEARSQHPLAVAILDHARERGLPVTPPSDFESLTGLGARATIDGEVVYVGSPRLFDKLGVGLGEVGPKIRELEENGKTVVVVGTKATPLGVIAIADAVRASAAKAIRDLKAAGIRRVVMLTGDNERAAAAIGMELGVDEVFAELSPEDKTKKVEELQVAYGKVLMVGDGVNDAPALALAYVGVAMGAAGTDVALETADVALMTDDLAKLPYLVGFSRRAWGLIRQNLVLSSLAIAALVVGALTGIITLPVAILAHEISEFVVIANGLRMLRS